MKAPSFRSFLSAFPVIPSTAEESPVFPAFPSTAEGSPVFPVIPSVVEGSPPFLSSRAKSRDLLLSVIKI